MASIDKQLLGTETVRALRAKGVQATICGLSANDAREMFFQAGADAFMFKPFPCEIDALQEELAKIVSSGFVRGQSNAPPVSHILHDHHV